MSKEEEAVGVIAKEAQAIAADAQRDLDEAMPAYYASVDALKSLNKKDVQEVKAYASSRPSWCSRDGGGLHPDGRRSPTGARRRSCMTDMANFLEKLQDYDKDNIPEKYIKGIQKYIKTRSSMPDTVGKVSKACQVALHVGARDGHVRARRQDVEPKKPS